VADCQGDVHFFAFSELKAVLEDGTSDTAEAADR
jgi:hypothetical protein